MTRRAPPLLLPFQRRWLEDPARVKIIEKSRRIGATWATAAHAVLEAASGKQDVWYVSYNEESGKEFCLDCAKWARKLNRAAAYLDEIVLPVDEEGDAEGARAFQLSFPSGKRITALPSSPRSLRGKQGLVIIDEAAFHDRLPEVLKSAFALLMWGGQVMVMSTHNGVDNPFNQLVEDVRDGKRKHSLHRVTIEDALAEGLYVRICAVTDQEWSPEAEAAWLAELCEEYGDGVREELYCEPVRGGASYLGRPLIESCMVNAPVVRLERDERWLLSLDQHARTREIREWCDAVLGPLCEKLPDAPHAFGWDFGRYSDRSVLAPFTLTQSLVRACPFLVELQGIPHNDQWTIMEYVGERLPSLFSAHLDAGGNGSWIAEQALTRWGDLVVKPVDITQKWYAENMPPFREAHERRTILYPRDLDVRNDLGLIRRIDGVPKLPKERTESAQRGAKRRHGDAAIALCLGYAAACDADREAERWSALSEGGRYVAGW